MVYDSLDKNHSEPSSGWNIFTKWTILPALFKKTNHGVSFIPFDQEVDEGELQLKQVILCSSRSMSGTPIL